MSNAHLSRCNTGREGYLIEASSLLYEGESRSRFAVIKEVPENLFGSRLLSHEVLQLFLRMVVMDDLPDLRTLDRLGPKKMFGTFVKLCDYFVLVKGYTDMMRRLLSEV